MKRNTELPVDEPGREDSAPEHDRRRIDRELAPAGAATEAAITRSVEVAELSPSVTASEEAAEHRTDRAGATLLTLAVGAAGVVYGDIGTSPLYTLHTAFGPEYGLTRDPASVYGILSLITWALVMAVSVKYVAVLMRADNRGEGGILALLALLLPDLQRGRSRHPGLWVAAGLMGAALLYGDGVITPAISVLSAVEGLELASPRLARFVVPLTVGILVALFALQRKGTGKVGRVFGPVMIAWFLVLGALGARELVRAPGMVRALSPTYAVAFVQAHGWHAVLVLGAVVLAVSGAEALYADMGHFGARPIRVVWFGLVLPCLLLNYLGQGALLLRAPDARNPFFQLAPGWMLYPMVALATAATVIASQALISGAFSITRQLMHLGYSPIVTVTHTSAEQEGQIYIPQVNWLLLAGAVVLVLGFTSSERLAAAYGLAVTGTMSLTTVLFYRVTRWRWGWSRPAAGALAALFLAVDLAFLGSNVTKVPHGGWVPLVLAGTVYFVFATWRRGREALVRIRQESFIPVDELIRRTEQERPCRTDGTGVFLSPVPGAAPGILRRCLEQIRALPRQVVLVTVRATDEARVPAAERLQVERCGEGIVMVTARYGYMQSIALTELLAACRRHGVRTDPETTTFYLARERVRPTGPERMPRWRKGVFIFLHRNAPTMQDFFALPAQSVLELGTASEL